MFHIAVIFIAMLACPQYALGSILPEAAPVVAGGYVAPASPLFPTGYNTATNSIIPSGYIADAAPPPSILSSTYGAYPGGIVEPASQIVSWVAPAPIGQQYVHTPVTRSYGTPLISGGLYAGGYARAYATSYGSQNLYTAPTAHATYGTPIGAYGAPLPW